MNKNTYNIVYNDKKDQKVLDFEKSLGYNQVVACKLRGSFA